MTPHDTVQGLLTGENKTRYGLYENIWPDTLRQWVDQGYPVDDSGKPLTPEDVFGYDLGRLGGAFDPTPKQGFRLVHERTDEWEIVENGAGVTQKVWLNKSAPAGPIAWKMDSEAVWRQDFKPLMEATDPGRVPAGALREKLARHRAADRWICYNMSFIWEDFRQTVGDICMYESLITDPEWVADYNQTALDFYIRHMELAFSQVGLPDGMWFSEDLAYNQGLFCSPATLEELVFPYYRQMIDYLHGKGLKVILHSCGNVERALDMIVDAGFDALHPMQVHAGCDPLSIAARYGGKLVLMGGLDTHILEQGDPRVIEDAQVRLMDGMHEAGARYIFCSDHSISTNVTYGTYQRMMETYHKHKEA